MLLLLPPLLLDKHNISLRAKVAVGQLKAKAQEIDQQLKISETASAVKKSATETAKEIDEEYGISEKASMAAMAVKTTAQSAAAKVRWTRLPLGRWSRRFLMDVMISCPLARPRRIRRFSMRWGPSSRPRRS